ncbi:MAG TPA: FHA domain-containing protein [Thermoanaerobaculia bacterium]|nr:FHA domain-containing protein [Thermoanaerobaculia bacterium]
MAIRLIVFQQSQKLGVELKDGAYRLGRDPKCDIVIADATVSSQHAEIQVLGDQCLIRDLGSSNGTFVNKERIQGAREIKPSDAVLVGAIPLTIELPKVAKARSGAVAPTARLEAQKAKMTEAKGRIPWAARYWIAGALAILSLMLILIFIQLYSEAVGSELRIMHRFKALGSQYMHILADPEVREVPAPVTDESLGQPILVLNRRGEVLYPPPVQGEEEAQPSPVVDPKTGRVYESAKYDLKKVDVRSAPGEAPVEVRSYPIRSGGDLLGFVLAKPALDVESNLASILAMIFLAGMIAMILLFFTLKPVHVMIRQQMEDLRTKLSAFANGFVDSLPRSANVPELSAMAAEAETVIRSKASAGAKPAEGRAGAGDEFAAYLGPLLDSAHLPYCFVDGDFRVLARSRTVGEIQEMSRAVIGNSIFESGLTNVQSKQLVEAIAQARGGNSGQATLMLSLKGTAREHEISVRAFHDPSRGEQIFGLVFQVRS